MSSKLVEFVENPIGMTKHILQVLGFLELQPNLWMPIDQLLVISWVDSLLPILIPQELYQFSLKLNQLEAIQKDWNIHYWVANRSKLFYLNVPFFISNSYNRIKFDDFYLQSSNVLAGNILQLLSKFCHYVLCTTCRHILLYVWLRIASIPQQVLLESKWLP